MFERSKRPPGNDIVTWVPGQLPGQPLQLRIPDCSAKRDDRQHNVCRVQHRTRERLSVGQTRGYYKGLERMINENKEQ